ncbi:sulfurtransferase TusA family protein [Brachybacterium sp. Marseille-Q7125]|uniref:sulfurtransferase TusA family protein n=1 Tax=Brachybacterium sp. Marseille-Q7125 TaxID=2932815 RepID=UPI001FF20A60|nr:sulfurtransferase TusA family protein [Brachybacterium sp. Marseille-Q7125]
MTQPAYTHEWDAGDLGCGELVVLLKLKLRDEMTAGEIIRLHGTDEGLQWDMPAWCGLTGNELVHAEPPLFFIRKGPAPTADAPEERA